MKMKKLMMVVWAVGAACAAGAVEYRLDAASSVRTLPDDPRVVPGHGPFTGIGFERKNNPYV